MYTESARKGDVRTSGDVLLVEDNRADIELTLHVMAEDNAAHRVHVVRDGEQALDFIFARGEYAHVSKPPVGLILLDLKLPKVNGLQVLKRIKEHPATKALPVVVLSSSNQLRDVDGSYQLGANGYVQKPVNFEEFSEALRRITGFWLGVNLAPSSALFNEHKSEPGLRPAREKED